MPRSSLQTASSNPTIRLIHLSQTVIQWSVQRLRGKRVRRPPCVDLRRMVIYAVCLARTAMWSATISASRPTPPTSDEAPVRWNFSPTK